MLHKAHRLPALDIPRVMKHGRRVSASGITLIYKKREMDPGSESGMTPRISFIVSTKVDKRATVRNRVRRLMSESVRHYIDSISGVDGVFIGSRGFVGLDQKEMKMVVRELLGRAKLLNT